MIVVAIVGILAAVALPADQGYIENANLARVSSHYEEAVGYVQNEFRMVNSDLVLGAMTLNEFHTDQDSAQWVAELNNNGGGQAPGGGPAYATAVNDLVGVVGVAVAGSVIANPVTYTVTVTRPQYGAYANFSVLSANVQWVNM